MEKLSTNIAGIELKNPLIIASGILGLSQKIFDRLYKNGAAAIVTKSISVVPREGYKNPTIVQVNDSSYINAVGLANPGAIAFSKEIENNTSPLIVSLVGSETKEFLEIVRRFDSLNILGYELNLSCPHVKGMGMEIGDDLNIVSEIIKSIKKISSKPLFVKIGLGNSNIVKTAQIAESSGADGITAINTIRAMKIDINTGYPILENNVGGLSGGSIKSIGVRCVFEIRKNTNLPIMGCGGIMSYNDALEYLMAGANAIQIGSMIGIKGINYLGKIIDDLLKYLDNNKYNNISEVIGIAHR